jgi:FtsZ-binding cell division protein ZapB
MESDFYEIISLLSNWKSTQKKELVNITLTVDELESKLRSTIDTVSALREEIDMLTDNVNSLEKENQYLKGKVDLITTSNETDGE